MSHCPRRPLSGSQVEASFRAWKFRRTSVRNSQRFQFCPLTYLPEPATEISKSPFGVTGSWHLKPRNLSRTQEPEAQNVISKNPFSVTAKSDFSLKTPVEWQG
jgi:hypothetical protein